MDIVGSLFGGAIVLLIIYMISRVAHYFNNNQKQMIEMNKK
ncbi:hypothetical protein [Jeotgalibacillus salarius]|nr:hypothetical protein [Jeotgalibacillus salarius]